MSPIDAQKSNNQKKLKNFVFGLPKLAVPAKLKVGDFVRLSRQKDLFEKKTGINWTFEIYKIRKVLMSDPRTYLLDDLAGEPLKGRFYELELKKTK